MNSFPNSTYRIQFHSKYTFKQAQQIVDYLSDLGISHLYSSPILKARPGSTHGYDVVDHSQINPEIGSYQDFVDLSNNLTSKNVGFVLDIVPNHVGTGHPSSVWWMDVLENGRASKYADFFDIYWSSTNPLNNNRVMIPTLGDTLGNTLEKGELKLAFEKEPEPKFTLNYYDNHFPVEISSLATVFSSVASSVKDGSADELNNLIKSLPSTVDADKRQEREDTIKKIKSLFANIASNSALEGAVQKALDTINKDVDALEKVVNQQGYRLCLWKIAPDEINYRRFFEINDLMAIAIDKPEVFEKAHQLVLAEVKANRIHGLRIDHPDGLFNPVKYFRDLRSEVDKINPNKTSRFPIWVEKILEEGEDLPQDWNVEGTTGYDYMNVVNTLYVKHDNEKRFREVYLKFIGKKSEDFNWLKLFYEAKKYVLEMSFDGDLSFITKLLEEISRANRKTRDYSYNQLKRALKEIIAVFPVYRTYNSKETKTVTDTDKKQIEYSIEKAKEKDLGIDGGLWEFVKNILLLTDKLSDDLAAKRLYFVSKFQQMTGPVMAKGLEDTAFYRFFLLTSLNEVGGDPDKFGCPIDEFHKWQSERAKNWKGNLSASSTHDTKRSEDLRARINVLSEIPDGWYNALETWRKEFGKYKAEVKNPGQDVPVHVPAPNEEQFIYQTLLGVIPCGVKDFKDNTLVERVLAYVMKAFKESKLFTSWTIRNEPYEKGVEKFIKSLLADDHFLASFIPFSKSIAQIGKLNSLSAVVVKMTLPGVPDTYQGTELWDLSLVDPDNRREVDYKQRSEGLKKIKESLQKSNNQVSNELLADLKTNSDNGLIKLLFTYRLLQARKANPALFAEGSYTPLIAEGDRKKKVVAFKRENGKQKLYVVSGRFFWNLFQRASSSSSISPDSAFWGVGSVETIWGKTTIPCEKGVSFTDVITGKSFTASDSFINVGELFQTTELPYAVLLSQ